MAKLSEPGVLRTFEIQRVTASGTVRTTDVVAAEEPLSIRLRYWFKETPRMQDLAVTMRTPGADRELVAGLLLSEGIITGRSDLVELRPLGIEPCNEMVAELAPSVDVESWRLARNSVVNSACGVCGKSAREAIAVPDYESKPDDTRFSSDLLHALPQMLSERQAGFQQTGGLHAAALVSRAGAIENSFEDIGRHNALDKLTGHSLLHGELPLSGKAILLSSRGSFELVQKTAMAGGKLLATVGGPSSLAIETARAYGITLIGFLRQGRFNIYSGEWRIN